jgi:soluble lytic murein transglycosylase-like protein
MKISTLRPRVVLAGALAASLGVALLPASASADIYTWTDENGVVHYSNSRAPKGASNAKLFAKGAAKKKSGRARVTPVLPSDRSPDRFTRYNQWIREAATLYQIPEELIRAVIKVESDYDPRAVSHANAQGLMQLIPETALRMQIRDPFDARMNIFAGTRYLRVLANHFNGDIQLTIAGYNAGEGAVIRYGGIPPYEETQNYVTRVLQYYHRYRTIRDVQLASK